MYVYIYIYIYISIVSKIPVNLPGKICSIAPFSAASKSVIQNFGDQLGFHFSKTPSASLIEAVVSLEIRKDAMT